MVKELAASNQLLANDLTLLAASGDGELSKMVKELQASNQLLANDLALVMASATRSGDDNSTMAPLMPNPPGTTTIEVLCQQMESSQADISTLYQQVGELQDGMDDLDYRMTTLEGQGGGGDSSGGGGSGDGGASGGYSGSFNSSAGWLNDFMSVEVDENNDPSLVITAPTVSIRTPQAKTITQQIQGQVRQSLNV